MSLRNEVSILSSSQILNNQNHRLSKRFRPSVQCNHIDKQTNEQCSADGFMECVHCDEICCLNHITQHQNELKIFRDNLIQEANEAYIKLSEMQVTDTRDELQKNLFLWKQRMLNKIEQVYEKLIDDVEQSFVKVNSDFELKKKDLANEFDENISTKLENISKKSDFYPHELDELRSSLDNMYIRIRDARTSLINIDYGNGNTYLLENDNTFQSPQILIQTKINIEQIINQSYIRQFHFDIENNSNLLYDTSNKHLLVCNNESNTIELYNCEERIGGGFWPEQSSSITSIKWSSYLNKFFVLCSQTLYSLNCSQEPFNINPVTQINTINGNPMKYLCIYNDLLLIKHGNGLFIDNYSLKTMELIKRWKKEDFYSNEDTIDIHRIEIYSNFNLLMNIEINEEKNFLDLFTYPNIQHKNRIENCYFILYFPLNNSWLIKEQKTDKNQMNLCLLNENQQINQLNINENENIIGMKLFGKDYLLVTKQNQTNSISIQFYQK